MCFRNEQCISLTKARPFQGRILKSFFLGGGRRNLARGLGSRLGTALDPQRVQVRSLVGGRGAEKSPEADGFSVLLKIFQAQL